MSCICHFCDCRQLNHPNIISLLGYSVNEDEIILITNFMDGHNLDRLLFGKKDKREVYT